MSNDDENTTGKPFRMFFADANGQEIELSHYDCKGDFEPIEGHEHEGLVRPIGLGEESPSDDGKTYLNDMCISATFSLDDDGLIAWVFYFGLLSIDPLFMARPQPMTFSLN